MNCVSCGHANRDTARFCEACGTALKLVCSSCKAELRPKARFCDECGQPTAATNTSPAGPASPPPGRPASASSRPLPSAAPPTGEARKIVSIIFADLAGSTALHERLDPESVRVFMEKYYEAMRGAVESHEGTIIKFLGDGVMAAFGVPRVSEDDALRSVRAGMAMQEAFAELARERFDELGELGLRVGINTGEVVVSSGNTDIVGDPVNITARLQQEARNGDVVIGESTQRLVGSWVTLMPLGRFALKGRSGGVKAFSVVSLDPPASAATAVFVGREEELGRLHTTYEAAVGDATVRLAVLVGSPGLGKSRLVEEFCHRLGDGATILRAHCDADTGATFVPLVRALREFFQLDSRAAASDVETVIAQALPEGDADHARISRGIAGFLSGSAATPEETFFMLRRLLGALAAERPAVLVLDDVHWAEPLLLEFIEHLVQWGSGLRLFVLLGARPEIREVRSSLVTPGGPVTEVLTLSGLDAGAAMRLAANAIGATDLPASLAARVLATSEGNPLFVGELVRMLVDEGIIERKGDRWVVSADLDTLEMPPTIHALLAARIERLKPEELAVLERAAVMGRQFSRGAVAELMPGDAKDLDARLEALRRAELIERDTGWFLGEPVLRFHHVLIRDAAYRRLLKGTRAELHSRLAAWIESKAEDLSEHEEILGWHLEQAHQLLRELGPLDSNGLELGRRASRHLASAGRHALALDDVALAANLLARALDRLEPNDPARPDLALDVCEALLAEGDVKRAASAIEVLEQASGDSARLKAWHTCFAGQLTVMTEPKGLQSTAERVAAAARELAKLEDAAGEAKAHFVSAQALARLGKVGACEAALDQALAAARRAGDRRRANAVLAGAPLAALWGPSPVTRASGRCLDVVRVLRITQGAPAVEAVALSCQGLLEALRGRTDAARRMIASARGMVEELGITHRLLETDVFAGRIDLLEGDAATAERRFRAGFEGLRELGHGIDAARAAALLGRALLAQDRADEAEAASKDSEKLAGDDLQASIAWRVVRARALAQRGDHAAAVEVARKAVEIAAATDALLDHADARLALALALRAAGKVAEAEAEEKRAFELWEAKGATELVERTRMTESRPQPAREAPSTIPRPDFRLPRRMRPNAASRTAERIMNALLHHDAEVLENINSDQIVVTHHPTGATYGAAEVHSFNRAFWRTKNSRGVQVPLATLGDSLALVRCSFTHEGIESRVGSIGAVETDEAHLFETDAFGCVARLDVFDYGRLTAAISRLYERYAELMPKGAGRNAAAPIAPSFEALSGRLEPESMVEGLSPSYVCVDHRTLGTWNSNSPGELVGHFRLQHELASGFNAYDEDILALEPRALLVRRTYHGTARDSGGSFENRILALWIFDDDGLIVRNEVWDAEQEAEALARFDELTSASETASLSAPVTPPPFRNTAMDVMDRVLDRWHARDWAGMKALFVPDFIFSDRRSMSRLELDLDAHIEMGRQLGDMPSSRLTFERTLTRGDRLVAILGRIEVAGGDVGPSDLEHWNVFEVDEAGHITGSVRFDADDEAAAVAELDRRYEGGEAAHGGAWRMSRRLYDSIYRRDREAFLRCFAPGFRVFDHRLLGWGTMLQDVEIFYRSQAAIVELSSEFHYRDDHFEMTERAVITQLGQVGTREGAAFENQFILVYALDEEGRIAALDVYGLEQIDRARARYAALNREGESPKVQSATTALFENAASRATSGGVECARANDMDRFRRYFAPDFQLHDRRRMAQLDLDLDAYVEFTRELVGDRRITVHEDRIATRGDRLDLRRLTLTIAQGDLGPSEVEHLNITEVDENGLIVAQIRFDPEDLDAAVAELDARYERGQPLHGSPWRNYRKTMEAVYRRDRETVLSLQSPDNQLVDHRVLGWGTTLTSPEKFYESQIALLDLAPDFRMRFDHFEVTGRAVLAQLAQVGTREGGPFESPFLLVGGVDRDGRFLTVDIYGLDQVEAARARYEALKHRPPEGRFSGSEEVFANAAFRNAREGIRAWESNAYDRIRALFRSDYVVSDRRKSVHLELDREATLDLARLYGEMEIKRVEVKLIATRGDRLSLDLTRIELANQDVEAAETVYLNLQEVDEQGLVSFSIRWDEDDLDAAFAELDARYEAGEGKEHPLCWVAYRAFNDALVKRDWKAIEAMGSPDVVDHDHRRLAVLGTSRGPEAWMKNFRTLVELAEDTTYRTQHFLGRDRGILSVGTWAGSREGGAYELPLVPVIELDETGRILRTDIYDLDQLAEARARFGEIGSASVQGAFALTSDSVFANAASRACDTLSAAFRDGEVDRLRPVMSEDFRFSDRRKAVQLELSYAETVKFTQSIERIGERSIHSELLATRGDRLALIRLRTEVAGDLVGPSEFHHLNLYEVDDQELLKAVIRWDEDDLDVAYEELDARYETGEGAGDPDFVSLGLSFREAFRTGQFEAVLQRCSPDFVRYDHRPLAVLGTAHGAGVWLQEMKSLMELAPDAVLRGHHLRRESRASLTVATWYGSREGGSFEIPIVLVLEGDAETQLVRADLYDPEQIVQALARFQEIGRTGPRVSGSPSPFENLAVRAGRSGVQFIEANNFERFREMFSESFLHIDRRRMTQLELDREEYVNFTWDVTGGRSVRTRVDAIATRGEYLALLRIWAEVEQGDVGPSELEHLNVIETDSEGRFVRQVRFDADDLGAAFEELDRRFEAGEAAGNGPLSQWIHRFADVMVARDWKTLETLLAPDLIGRDHRLVSWGTLEGPTEFMKTLQEMVKLAPDAWMRTNHVRFSSHAALFGSTWFGTRDGGEFESPYISVLEIDPEGRARSADFYDPEQVDQALARFEELKPAELLNLRMPAYIDGRANPVLKAWRAWLTALDAGLNHDDWEPVRAITSPDVRFEDRQRRALVSGDREMMIESLKARRAADARVEASLLGMAADRVAVVRMLWSGGPANGRFEVEYIGLIEIDEMGLLTATLLFDADAFHDLQREMWDRWAAIDPTSKRITETVGAFRDAFNERDRERLKAALTETFQVEDHRRTGMGSLDGAEAYLASVDALWELSQQVRGDVGWFWLAHDRDAALTVVTLRGTNVDGGSFETESLFLFGVEDGRMARLELFEIDALDRALARFEELRPDPLRIPPNAATRVIRQIRECRAKRDPELLRKLVAPDFTFDDRKKRSLVKGGVDEWMRALEFLWTEADAHPKERLVATAGDRLALHRVDWHEAPGESRFDIEGFRLIEVDEAGLIRALLLFDADDQDAAHAELFRRLASQDPHFNERGSLKMIEAVNRRDLSALYDLFAEDFVLDDHRRTGLGQLRGGKAYIESLEALLALTPEMKVSLLCFHRSTARGSVMLARTSGLNAEGGEFESFYISVFFFRDRKIARLEFYEPEQLETALQRFDESTAESDLPV